MIYTPEAIPNVPAFAYLISVTPTNGWHRQGSGFIPGGTIPMSQIQVGETTYRLRRPVQGVFIPSQGITWEFWVEGFSPTFVGGGAQGDEAWEDWRDQVHESFQDLYRKRPFEMTPEEAQKWAILEDMIDVVAYQNETPVLVRQLGQVTKARPLPRQITWVDGTKEGVRLELMPDEFASFKPGQWFEAIVERDPLTWHLRRVRFVQRTPSLFAMPETALTRYWSSLVTTETLPESKRDWTRR